MGHMGMLDDSSFLRLAKSNPDNVAVLELLPRLNLPQCYLTAGCLFQPIWNHKSERAPNWGIKDYDVFYWDEDVSWEAENEVIERSKSLFGDMEITAEIRNQARVHLWYKSRFGHEVEPLLSTKEGVESFLISCTCVGIDVFTGALYAPNGFDDLWNGILRMNPTYSDPTLFYKKASAYQERWPWLTIVEPVEP
jgi:hypothetical protein